MVMPKDHRKRIQGVGMLFGHQNNDVTPPTPDPTPAVQVSPTLNPLAVDPTTGVSLPVVEEPEAAVTIDQSTPNSNGIPLPPPPTPLPTPDPTTAPVATLEPDVVQPEPVSAPDPIPAPAEPVTETIPEPAPVPTSEPAEPTMPLDDEPAPEANAVALPTADELLAMKQQALEQLSPLVDKLDQSPEERFRTKMMMIQSTDDQTLIKEAYEAAQAIPDEKSRAQALLDVINEINYFTTPRNDQ
jgi:hypothetical protein